MILFKYRTRKIKTTETKTPKKVFMNPITALDTYNRSLDRSLVVDPLSYFMIGVTKAVICAILSVG